MRLLLLLFALLGPLHAAPAAPSELESAGCWLCQTTATMLHKLWGSKATEDCIGDLVTYLCGVLKIEDHFVCKGISGQFKEEFMWVTGQLIVNPKEICGILLKDCEKSFNPFISTWNITIPGNKPPHKEPILPTLDKPKLRIVHISDLHVDLQYAVGTEADCGEPQCCRMPKNNHELDAKAFKVKKPAGYWGTIGSCDTPYWTLDNMMQHIQKTEKNIDYIIVSGDLESHADWDYTHASHQEMIRNTSALFKQYFPNVNTYFAVGNHEGVPIDNFAPRWAPEKFNMDWLYGTMAESWKGWVPNEQLPSVKFNGCYMKKLFPGLRLVSLNNALGDAMNFYLYVNQTDPDGTMTWFVNQLADAEAAGDKVHVVSHIPGGDTEALEGWAHNYYKVINRFEDTVAVQFFGHMHSEQYYIMYENPEDFRSRPTSIVYATPSVTTYSQFNPAYRVYTIDGVYPGSSYRILDFEEYFLNVTKANENPSSAKWETLYSSVKEEYGLKSLEPFEWNILLEKMKADDGLFSKYMKNYYRQDNMPCDESCKKKRLCEIRQAHHSQALCSDLGVNILDIEKPATRASLARKRPSPMKSMDEVYEYLKNSNLSKDKCPI
uniref:Sphingomyelin phosphodiesterase n=1 Tax=Steinernema glaseri TaxID=37863 RepID=A0A1I8ABT4_9BILA